VSMPTVTFVTPRYGREVVGGAEGGARSLASRMAADGWDVTVLTTCARSAVTWSDEYREGSEEIDGVAVHRFATIRPRDPDFDALCGRVLADPGAVDAATAWDWIDRQGPDAPGLLDAVAEVDRGVLALYPYLYQPTVRGRTVARVQTVLHAAAHAEAPRPLPLFADLFGGVDALAHHTRAEQQLVDRWFPGTRTTPQVVLGLPIDEQPADPHAARRALGLGDEPFVVALGRIDRGKGIHDLVERFTRWRARRGAGRLVLAGPVVHPIPPTAGVTVLGLIDETHKAGLLAAADVLINPSPQESFSIVIHEAWLAGTPVLVNGWSGPMVEHCAASGGGLWWTGAADFDIALSRLVDDAALRARMARGGRAYTERTAAWPAVRSRYEALLARLG